MVPAARRGTSVGIYGNASETCPQANLMETVFSCGSLIPGVVIWIRLSLPPPPANILEYLVPSWWNCLARIRSVALLGEVGFKVSLSLCLCLLSADKGVSSHLVL